MGLGLGVRVRVRVWIRINIWINRRLIKAVWKYTCCATDSRHLFAYFTDYIVVCNMVEPADEFEFEVMNLNLK